jgi:hypothetical protein
LRTVEFQSSRRRGLLPLNSRRLSASGSKPEVPPLCLRTACSVFLEAWPERLNAPWLFLLDGFDEVHSEHREEMLAWLNGLVGGDAAFITTSRPTEVLDYQFRRSLMEFVVLPFSKEQQLNLAENSLGEVAIPFLEAFASYSDGELGGTPLLLTVAAIEYLQSSELPNRRSEL